MINLLGLGKTKLKRVKVTIEYCPKNVTMPYKVKKLINESSLTVPMCNNKSMCNNKQTDPFGFEDKIIRVGEFLNEKQVEHLVMKAKSSKSELDSVEIIEGSASSRAEDLLLD